MESLKGRIASTERAIARLQERGKALASGRGRAARLQPGAQAELRRRGGRLHQKKRRLHALRARREAEERHSALPSLCFGSRRPFRAQFHLEENGVGSHAQWLPAWRQARSGTVLCLGIWGESRGNQTCGLLLDGTLRLRVPHALASRYGAYLAVPGVRFPYGQEVIDAALGTGQAVSYRFVRRGGVWSVQATTERPVAERVTARADLEEHVGGRHVRRLRVSSEDAAHDVLRRRDLSPRQAEPDSKAQTRRGRSSEE